MLKKEAIQSYIDWLVESPEYKKNLREVCEIYWDYYSEAEDGARLALEHWERNRVR